jgi:dolichol-phosphate mannosyltransferase
LRLPFRRIRIEKMKDSRVAVIVPTYNEGDNIRPLAEEILASPLEAQLIIVDDNSPDGTGQIADEMAKDNPRVDVIHRQGKMGLGTAYVAGFKKALALGTEHIITMDADFSHHPHYLTDLVAGSQRAGLVIGSRYVPGGGTLRWGLERRFLSWAANLFARLALGLRARDCTSGLRCYQREVLESINLDEIFSDGYSFLIEMLYKSQKKGFRIGEVPIVFEDRRQGKSKISRAEIAKALYTVMRLSVSRLPFLG